MTHCIAPLPPLLLPPGCCPSPARLPARLPPAAPPKSARPPLCLALQGTKPDFKAAAAPAEALETYEALLDRLREGFREPEKVKDGVFGAMMKVSLVNDGPVTLTIDSREGKGSGSG